jgi:hypothetical protein
MQIKLIVFIQNLGDGSCAVRFFNSEEDAEAYAGDDDERYCDDIYPVTLEVDESGKLLNPDKK